MYCTYCGSSRHIEDFCPKTAQGQSNRLHLRCSYCGATNHNYEACPKLARSIQNGGVRLKD